MPIFFIWPLNRPVIERILITVLMGLGIIAATAGAMKLYYIGTWKFGEEAVKETVSIYMWYRVEEISLIASACAPLLKGPTESMLSRLGLQRLSFAPLSLKTFRSGGRSAAMDVPEENASTEQQLTQDTDWAVSMDSRDRANDKRQEMDHTEGV
jgi:hypothetical protein